MKRNKQKTMATETNTLPELPCINFERSRLISDFELEKVSLNVSAETSGKALKQFKDILNYLEQFENDRTKPRTAK